MNTILLSPTTWDLLLNSDGNIAMASNPYSIAQDVASAIKLFLGELYYNTGKGVPYFDRIFSQSPNSAVAIMAAQSEQAALTVPEVVSAKCTQLYYDNRTLSGVLEVIDTTGTSHNVKF